MTIPTAELDRIVSALGEIEADMETDTNAREGQPLTGPNVARWLGEICGTVAGLAAIVRRIAEEHR